MQKSEYPKWRMEIFARILSQLPRGRLLDLGCGHGAMSLLAHNMGWQVTGVDVRTERMPRFDGITWVQSDIRDFAFSSTDFDVIALLGLVYHLELKDQLDLLRRCAGTLTIVDTHVSLAPTVEEAGYNGELFDEKGPRTAEQHAQAAKSSWLNVTSFWADEESLLRMFADCGFAHVYKLSPPYRPDRTFYICHPAVPVRGFIRNTFDLYDQR